MSLMTDRFGGVNLKNKNLILNISIIFFTFIMPIIPSTFHYQFICLAGDMILYLIIVYFIGWLIFNKDLRNNICKNYKKFFNNYLNVFMIIWSLSMFISVFYARDKMLAFTESIRLSSYVFLFFILKYYIFEIKIYNYILKSYMLTSFIIGIYGIYENFVGMGIIVISKFGSEVRVSSFMENSNNLGMYFVFAIFPFIVLLIKDKKIKNKIIYLVLTLISLANIVFSGSRNALIGFTIGILILIITLGVQRIYLLLLPVLIYCMPTVSTRVKDISDTSQNLSRLEIWKLALLIIKDHPILGVGNGNYTNYIPDYLNSIRKINYNFRKLIHPHNILLKVYSELGLLGLISFIGLFLTSFFSIYNFIKNKADNFYNWFYTGVLASLFSMLFMNLLDSFLSAPKVIVYYFILLGVNEGIKRISGDEIISKSINKITY